MKKLYLVMAVLLVFVLAAGCTQSNQEPTAAPATAAPASQTVAPPSATPTPEPWKPDHTINMIIPFGAGGSTDLLGRKFAEAASKIFGVSVVVNNVAGASGTTGAAQAAQAPADGYNVFFTAAGPLLTQPHMIANLPYTLDSFTGLTDVMSDTSCIAVRADSKYQTLEDLLADKDSDILVGNTGKGTLHHLLQLAFASKSGLKLTDVPFQGGAALWTGLLGNQIEIGFGTPAEVVPYVQSGDLRVLAVATPERMKALPDVPTLKEKGLDIELTLEFFLLAPAGLPDDVSAALEAGFMQAAQDPSVVEFINSIGSTSVVLNGADLMDKLKSDYTLFGQLFEAAGITPQ